MGQPMPDELFVSNISSARGPVQSEPTALLSPTLDGEETSYFEWLGAGVFEVLDVAGAMHQIGRAAPRLTSVRFGFDRERLYVRVDGRQPMAEVLADGYEVALKFLAPAGRRFSVRSVGRPGRGRPLGTGRRARDMASHRIGGVLGRVRPRSGAGHSVGRISGR